MPPGNDGLWTAERIRELDPMVNILIMTAYSDIDPAEISAKVQPVDKLLYAQKPLRPQEIRQFAAALSSKWQSESQLINTNLQLATARNRLEELLRERTEKLQNVEERLEERSTELAESGVAMKVLLKNISSDNFDMDEKVRELDERIVLNVKELTEPFLERLERSDLDAEQRECLTILRSNLDKVTSPAMQRLYSDDHDLTPSELQVANLIRQGRKTKEIASLLNLSTRTIEFHRDNIRKKLGIRDRKTSLKSILKSI
jgi:DNA-binding NarL/FixJ family response regulator